MAIRKIMSGDRYLVESLVDDLKIEVNHSQKNVKISWNNKNGQTSDKRLFRKNNLNDKDFLSADDDFTYIDSTINNEIIDWKIGNNQRVHYQVESSDGSFLYSYSDEVVTDWDDWTIMSLISVDDTGKMPIYRVGEVWNFICDVDSGQISRNINQTVHVGTSSYAQTSKDNTIYESGSFSANLLSINCVTSEIVDDIQRVNKWMNFITNNDKFILKSRKGDVWVVSISGNPQRSYEESTPYTLTTVSYEWVEVEDINNIIVR